MLDNNKIELIANFIRAIILACLAAFVLVLVPKCSRAIKSANETARVNLQQSGIEVEAKHDMEQRRLLVFHDTKKKVTCYVVGSDGISCLPDKDVSR